jgi:hypothetical protein
LKRTGRFWNESESGGVLVDEHLDFGRWSKSSDRIISKGRRRVLDQQQNLHTSHHIINSKQATYHYGGAR